VKPKAAHAVEKRPGRLLDADGAVALHVRVAAHGHRPARADIAAHHHQVGQHLDGLHRMLVLVSPCPGRSRRTAIDRGKAFDFLGGAGLRR
jgi:hypothetical protein